MIREYNQAESGSKLQQVGVGGFTLFAKVREGVSMPSQSPTTYLEDGSYVNDHIVTEAIKVTIEGSVSDTYISAPSVAPLQNTRQDNIQNITAFLPARPPQQVQAIRNIESNVRKSYAQAEKNINQKNIIAQVGDQAQSELRRKFFDAMEKLYQSKQLVAIETEYRIYENMVLNQIDIVRDNQNEALSFSISASQVRFAKTESVRVAFNKPSGGLKGQSDPQIDKGVQQGEKVETSILAGLLK